MTSSKPTLRQGDAPRSRRHHRWAVAAALLAAVEPGQLALALAADDEVTARRRRSDRVGHRVFMPEYQQLTILLLFLAEHQDSRPSIRRTSR
jgi:hypothetical protein